MLKICPLASTGLGFSFMAVPAIVAVNLYFMKLRPLANGLSSAGAGLGYVIMPMTMSLLVDEFQLRRALKMLGAITTTAIVASLFLWPFVEEVTVTVKEEEEKKSVISTNTLPVVVLPDQQQGNPEREAKPFSSMPLIKQPSRKVTFLSLGDVNMTLETHVVLPLSRNDIFYSGFGFDRQSRDDLSNQRNCAASVVSEKDASWWKDLMKTLDFVLFMEPDFLLIVVMASVTQLAYFVPFVYLFDYAAVVHGIPDKQVLVIGVVLGKFVTCDSRVPMYSCSSCCC